MAKKHMTKGAKSETVSLLEKYAGKTEARGGFNPIWKPTRAGEECLAEYVKQETVIGQGEGKKKKDDYSAFIFKLKEGSITLQRGKKTEPYLESKEGTLFTVSGNVMESALKDAAPATDFILRFEGMGEAKNGNNAPKLFTVHALIA